MAGWLEQNADRLVRQPLLQERGEGTGNGAIGADTAGQAPSSRPRQAGKSTAPAETAGKVLRESEQLIGKTEGGPGSWQLSPKRTGGEAYQEQITGVRRGIEYDVPSDRVPSGKVRFDGFDAERKVLLDAKDWKGYPPKDVDFWQKKLSQQANNQLTAAKGIPVEWHFSTQESLFAVRRALDAEQVSGIRLVLTPKS
ncbi:MAG: Tox-REase-5 domain-containing protein [Pseudomonadota bacterium]